jgi:hypothetical protein
MSKPKIGWCCCSDACPIHPPILIENAPAMLEALKSMVEVSRCKNGCAPDDMTCATNAALAVIARAEGRS